MSFLENGTSFEFDNEQVMKTAGMNGSYEESLRKEIDDACLMYDVGDMTVSFKDNGDGSVFMDFAYDGDDDEFTDYVSDIVKKFYSKIGICCSRVDVGETSLGFIVGGKVCEPSNDGEYGVRYGVVGRNERIAVKERFFKSEKDREKFLNRMELDGRFVSVVDFTDPRKADEGLKDVPFEQRMKILDDDLKRIQFIECVALGIDDEECDEWKALTDDERNFIIENGGRMAADPEFRSHDRESGWNVVRKWLRKMNESDDGADRHDVAKKTYSTFSDKYVRVGIPKLGSGHVITIGGLKGILFDAIYPLEQALKGADNVKYDPLNFEHGMYDANEERAFFTIKTDGPESQKKVCEILAKNGFSEAR